MNITIDRNGTRYGPYTLEQIKEYLNNGSVSQGDWAWYEGCANWLQVKEIVSSATPASKLPPPPITNPSATNLYVATSGTSQLLKTLGMSQYEDVFRQNNIQEEQLLELTDSDLEKMGIESMGHRKAIISGIHNTHVSADMERCRMTINLIVRWYFRLAVIAALILLPIIWILFPIMYSISPERELGVNTIGQAIGSSLLLSLACLVLSVVGYLYMLPTIIAWKRANEYRWAILIVNTLFGITFIVWIILLAVALDLIDPILASVLAVLAPHKK